MRCLPRANGEYPSDFAHTGAVQGRLGRAWMEDSVGLKCFLIQFEGGTLALRIDELGHQDRGFRHRRREDNYDHGNHHVASTRPWPVPPQQVSSWPRHSARYACHGTPRPPRQSRRRLGPQQPPGSPHVFHGRSWCASPSHSSPDPWPCVEADASIMPMQWGRRALGQPAPRKPIRTTMERRCRAIRSSL